LGAKYNISHQAVSLRAKTRGWTQDLADQIRQATNARLVAQLVDEEVAKTGREIANSVIAAADINAQVILSHRKRLSALHADLEDAKALLHSLKGTVDDVKAAALYVSAMESAVRSTKLVIEGERKAFKLDDEDTSKSLKPKRVVIDFEDAEVKE
jgi:hypothetical protein